MAYFNNLDIEIQNQKMEDKKGGTMTDEIRKNRKEKVVSVLNDMKLSRKKELDRYLRELHGLQNPDFYTGAAAAFEFLWKDIEMVVKNTMGIIIT